MVIQHQHPPGSFDPGHCRGCAHRADLLDHYWQVQREELAFKQAHRWARWAHRHASWALWASGVGVLVAVIPVRVHQLIRPLEVIHHAATGGYQNRHRPRGEPSDRLTPGSSSPTGTLGFRASTRRPRRLSPRTGSK